MTCINLEKLQVTNFTSSIQNCNRLPIFVVLANALKTRLFPTHIVHLSKNSSSFFVMTLPFGFVFSLGYYVIPVVIFIFYVLASLELIAEEIEDPFGNDANDLPMTKIASNIKKHVEEIL